MTARLLIAVRAGIAAALSVHLLAAVGGTQEGASRRISWADVASLQARLEGQGLRADAFADYVARTSRENSGRVRLGDLDHLVFYLLQSTRFTSLPPIEPAVSARGLVESLEAATRDEFLKTGKTESSHVPPPVRARIAALLKALEKPGSDARLVYFRELVAEAWPRADDRASGLGAEYLRAMRFVYEKEFVAQRAARPAEAVADLYRTRGLSTDTAVEAGYLVHLGLEVVKSLHPQLRIRRVLIVGPGMDLAPRTGFQETPPESYQPWAVIDALVATGLARIDDLEVTAGDINPRVVAHLRRSRSAPPTLSLTSEIAERDEVTFSRDYREYFAVLGNQLSGEPARMQEQAGHLHKSVRVGAAAARALRAEPLDIVTERLTSAPFDLVIATNILPYFDDLQLTLATSNIAAMLASGGTFLHNEARPILGDLTSAVGLPFEQSRHAVIATVRGASPPLFDSVFIHRKQ